MSVTGIEKGRRNYLHLLILRKVSLLLIPVSSRFPVLIETDLDASEPLRVVMGLRSLIPNFLFFK